LNIESLLVSRNGEIILEEEDLLRIFRMSGRAGLTVVSIVRVRQRVFLLDLGDLSDILVSRIGADGGLYGSDKSYKILVALKS